MPLIVEDGSNVPNANSYADIEFANTYHEAQGNTDWVGEDAELERALQIACRSLEMLYGQDYKSTLLQAAQSLLYPRDWFTDNNGRVVNAGVIPKVLREAQCEIALMYLQGVDVFPNESENAIKQSTLSVGEVSEATTYFKHVEKERFPGFRKIDLILAPILNRKPSSWRIRA